MQRIAKAAGAGARRLEELFSTAKVVQTEKWAATPPCDTAPCCRSRGEQGSGAPARCGRKRHP